MSFKLDKHTYAGANNVIQVWTTPNVVVKIGKYCSLASNIRFVIDGNHKWQTFSTFPFRERFGWSECPQGNYGKEIPTVGNDVWIGNDAVIYSGCHIGDGAIVAGQSVVTKSVPPYAIVAGNPARVVKYRFEPEVIEKLLKYKWWDLDETIIREKLIPVIEDINEVCKVLEDILK